MNGKSKFAAVAKIIGVLASVAVGVGGWCYALGQRSSDTTVEKRVTVIELKQAGWEARWDERWDRILEELKGIHASLSK